MPSKKIAVPRHYNYVSASLTFRCNLSCDYCINGASGGIDRAVSEMSGKEWIEGLNRLDLKDDMPITLEGGEPSCHPGFYDIIDGVRHRVNILTNARFNVGEFINKVDPRRIMRGVSSAFKPIRISYHAQTMNIKETVAKATHLQEAGFGVGIFGISHPDNLADNIEMAEECRRAHIYWFIKDFLGEIDGSMVGYYRYPFAITGDAKPCLCRTNEILIDPAGKLYRCHRDLYAHEEPIGGILDDNVDLDPGFRECERMGLCNPCDVKAKTNRFLEAGNSSVVIR